MNAISYTKDGFLHIGFVGNPKQLNDFLKPYDDGQGRKYDILDEELSYE